MALLDEVRSFCRAVAETARFVSIDLDAEAHYLEGDPGDVAAYLLTLDAVNFGSGWFPTLRKRPGRSGYFTVAWALADRFRAHGPWSNAELRALDAAGLAAILGQEPGHPLMRLYAEALRDLGRFFDDRGFYKRAQILPSDLALAGLASFHDLDRLTIFADNLVPHVLRIDGVLRYDPGLAARIDAGELLPPGREEREIRGCALHACEQLAERTGTPPRLLDIRLWNRGQAPEYKRIPRHRTRSVYY